MIDVNKKTIYQYTPKLGKVSILFLQNFQIFFTG